MKNSLHQTSGRLVLSVMILFAMSCEGPEGPAGPQGQPGVAGAQGPQGPPADETFEIIDFETTADGWFADGEEGEVGFSALFPASISEIDADVTANGVVVAFAELFGQVWTPLPFSLNTGADYTSHLGYFYFESTTENPENFLINTYDSDNLAPTFAGQEFKVRLVIFKGGAGSRMNLEELKGKSWEELEKILEDL